MRRVCLVAAACAALPDIDYFEWPVAHRAITHSLAFAVVGAVVATFIFFRGPQWTRQRARIALILGLALLSHALLDALSTYSFGVEFFAPFSEQRYRFPWTPLGDPAGTLAGQLRQEALVVFLPAVLLGWLGFRLRRARVVPAV
jgi:inner membrane protein